ncbi:MAG: hypothetical protein QM758_28730 [Armatimonas sp.]
MPLQFRPEEKKTPAVARPEGTASLATAPSGTTTHTETTPTFRRIGQRMIKPLVRRPRLTKRGAAITIALSGLVMARWWYANLEPNWPTYVPSYPDVQNQTGPNAANFYHAAMESYKPTTLPEKLRGTPSTWTALNEASAPLEAKRLAMQDNTEALNWLHEAGTRTYYGNHGGKWLKTQPLEGPRLSDPVPNFISIRELARTAAGSCDVLAAEGQHLAAVDRALDIAKWGTDMTHDPTLIESMIGVLIQGIGYQKAVEHIDSLTPEEAKVALARLEKLPKPAAFSDIVRHEEMMVANTYKDVFQMSNVRGFQEGPESLTTGLAGHALYDAMLLWYTKRGLIENYTSVMNEYARIGAMPYHEASSSYNMLQKRIDSGQGMNFLTRIVVPNMVRARWAYEAKIARREVIRAELMLKVWKAEHGGKLPASLSELKNVPLDSLSAGANQPLRYDGVTGKVWSVGSNGIDEHGAGDDTLENP